MAKALHKKYAICFYQPRASDIFTQGPSRVLPGMLTNRDFPDDAMGEDIFNIKIFGTYEQAALFAAENLKNLPDNIYIEIKEVIQMADIRKCLRD